MQEEDPAKQRQLTEVIGNAKQTYNGENYFVRVILHVLAWCLFLLGLGYAIF